MPKLQNYLLIVNQPCPLLAETTHIRSKFSTAEDKISCKFGIHKDKILVRRIGKRGEGNYNEVWAGRLVNNAAKLAGQTPNIAVLEDKRLPILVSQQVYEDFEANKEYGYYHCCNTNGTRLPESEDNTMWNEFNDYSDETLGDKFYYTKVLWCEYHADNYMELIK